VLCAEVMKLQVKLVERAKVIQLPLAKAVGAAEPSDVDRQGEQDGGGLGPLRLATPFATPANETLKITACEQFRRRDSNPDKRHQKPLSCL
jgi:hypothetical protein